MALSQDFLYNLKANNSIDSVMSSYIPLQRRGRNFVCSCPFHSEKTPSCYLYPETQSFYCFGCGAGGDVITFVMKIENLEYIEAVKFLAERSGIAMPEDSLDNHYAKIKSRTLEINREAAKFFYNQLTLPKSEKGRMYFQKRELLPSTIKKYGLGYAPNDWHELTKYMLRLGYTEDELITAALAARGRDGRAYDIFRDRAMFPIIDLRGNVIAFGGRIIDGDGSGPKYLNSSDTPVFKKSNNLFSLNFAKRSDEKRLILAEGYMDVISINQAGFENVVATLGTALTGEQARLMSQYANEVIIAYDSDGAGQRATQKAINLLGEAGVKTRIINMTGAKDPDEYIKKFGAIRFGKLLDQSDGAMNFQLAKCREGLDTELPDDKVEYLKRCVKVIASLTNPMERDIYIGRLSVSEGVTREVLAEQVKSAVKKQEYAENKARWTAISSPKPADKVNPDAVKYPKENSAEIGIIVFLHKNPDKLSYVRSKLPPEEFVTEFNRRVYDEYTKGLANDGNFSLFSMGNVFSPQEMGKISEMLAKFREITISDRELEDYIRVLKDFHGSIKISKEMSDDELRELQKLLKHK